MYNVETMAEELNETKEGGVNLSSEFKQEIKRHKKKISWFGLTTMILVCVIVFGALGIGTYEIFFKEDKTDQKTSSEKIQSKPEATEKKSEATKETKTPSASTDTTSTTTTEEYVVQEGDVLGSIAAKFDTTVEKLKAANNITDETLLQIGQKIKIVK